PRAIDSWSKVARLEDAKLIEELSSFDATLRERARRELVKRGDKNRAELIKLLKKSDARLVARINAAWALGWMYDADVQTELLKQLASGDDELKYVCATVIGLFAKKGDVNAQDGLLQATSEEDPAIRRVLNASMGRLRAAGAA